jgi:LysW-gamma-L-lysine carboxypeptidase
MNETLFLERLVSIPSPSGKEEAVGEFLVRQMTALGFKAHRDQIGNAIGTIESAKPKRTIILLGHMDTVLPNLPVHQKDNLLYGRGTVDAKGALATFVMAAAQVAPKLEHTRVVVIGAVEEEDPRGRGAHH